MTQDEIAKNILLTHVCKTCILTMYLQNSSIPQIREMIKKIGCKCTITPFGDKDGSPFQIHHPEYETCENWSNDIKAIK